jgi:hypothetical protein
MPSTCDDCGGRITGGANALEDWPAPVVGDAVRKLIGDLGSQAALTNVAVAEGWFVE